MRIASIESFGLSGASPEGGWTNEISPDDVIHTLILVHTDEGVTGVGSVFATDKLVAGALEVLAPLLLGESPLEVDRLNQTMQAHTFWMGRGGSIGHAISGVDIALWDILGKATGQSVGVLLGGKYRSRVRPYASLLIKEPALLREELDTLIDHGFTAFKLGWGEFGRRSSAFDEDVVSTAREVIGSDRLLAIDAGGSDAFWTKRFPWAVRTARMLAAYDVAWFEEPLPPDDVEGYVALRGAGILPISGGEVFARRHEFARFMAAGAFDIVQPDTTKGGGLSESRRVAWLADDLGVSFIPHGWNTAIGLAADLQLASALPNVELVEYTTGSAYIDDLLTEGFSLDSDGFLAVPDGPGLGVSLDPERLARYTRASAPSHWRSRSR